MTPDRHCDGCQECCFHTPVLPLAKPGKTRCPHQCAEGCAVYEYRPSACATYQCAWLSGHLPEWAKPNECGMLFETAWLHLNGGKRFTLLSGWITDEAKAMPFEDRFGELLQHANVALLLDVPRSLSDDGTLVMCRDSWSEGVFRELRAKITAGGVEYRCADSVHVMK